jgi:aminocarboxymuconate-semialdehyde decarboxylase
LIVDSHCHIIVAEMTTPAVPERWRPALGHSDGRPVAGFRGKVLRSIVGEFTDVDLMLAQAAAQGVDHLLLSPWIMLVPTEAELSEALTVCQVQNEALSRLAVGRPGQISALGAVPLQDPAAAARCLDALMRLPGMYGVEIPASVSGSYLGDDRFEPFWEAAQATGALIFIHPTTTGFQLPALSDYYLWNSVGNPLETAITAAHLAAAGVLDRHHGLKLLLAHGGGGLHAVRGRLRRAFAVRPEASSRSAAGPDVWLRRFRYDSLTHDLALLADLVASVGADRVLLGSDRPFDMGADDPVADVRALGQPDAEDLILGGNAQRLLDIPMPGPAAAAGVAGAGQIGDSRNEAGRSGGTGATGAAGGGADGRHV